MKHSNTLDRSSCVEAAEKAVKRHGYPEIIHSDKRKQYLSKDFLKVYKDEEENEKSLFSYREKGYKENIYI